MAAPVTIDVASVTHPGLRRSTNEDSVLARHPVFVVADGMGGHDAGDLASAIVVEELSVFRAGVSIAQVNEALRRSRFRIDTLPGRKGSSAGTTVSGIIMVEDLGAPYWLVINLGDSRTYRMKHGMVEQVSVDHSEVQHLIETGKLSPERAREHPHRNVVTRVLGAGTVERPDYWLIPVGDDERWMICSDGLTAEVSDERIMAMIAEGATPQATVTALTDAALAAGGRDNISIIVLDARSHDGGCDETLGGFTSPSERQFR